MRAAVSTQDNACVMGKHKTLAFVERDVYKEINAQTKEHLVFVYRRLFKK